MCVPGTMSAAPREKEWDWAREVVLPFQEILEICREVEEVGWFWDWVWRTRKWFEREREVEGWRLGMEMEAGIRGGG